MQCASSLPQIRQWFSGWDDGDRVIASFLFDICISPFILIDYSLSFFDYFDKWVVT